MNKPKEPIRDNLITRGNSNANINIIYWLLINGQTSVISLLVLQSRYLYSPSPTQSKTNGPLTFYLEIISVLQKSCKNIAEKLSPKLPIMVTTYKPQYNYQNQEMNIDTILTYKPYSNFTSFPLMSFSFSVSGSYSAFRVLVSHRSLPICDIFSVFPCIS